MPMTTISPSIFSRVLCLVTQSCLILCNPMDCSLPGSSVHGDSPGKNTGVGCHTLLQGIFPTKGSNPGLPHCRQILYCLSHQGSPRILEWVAYPFSRGTSWPKNQIRVSCIAGGFFTSWATREVHNYHYRLTITFGMKLNPNEFLQIFRVIHMIVFFYWDKLSREGNVECLSSSIVI